MRAFGRILLCFVLSASLSATRASSATPPPTGGPSPDEKAAADTIRPAELLGAVRFLSDDLLEGRNPGSPGDLLAQRYLATELEKLGYAPGAPNGTYVQAFDIVGVRSKSAGLTFSRGAEKESLKPWVDYVAFAGTEAPTAEVARREIVFVGYGIVAPEYRWDDYKGADLKGKVLLFLNNDPEDDPVVFAGKTRLYYGRWDYKYEMAAKKGAAGAIIIHTTPSAAYPWQVVQSSWSGENFSLPSDGTSDVPVKMWLTEEASRRLTKMAGKDLEALVASAKRRDFRPVPLGVEASLELRNEVRRTTTANVIGKLGGSDPVLSEEAVLYTAHHDHLGRNEDAKPGEDAIYNGALDNASGCATVLAIAKAFAALPARPKRSVLIAFVAGEERGLLGSLFLAHHLPMPAGRIATNINVDGASIWGRTRDVAVIGLGKSSLDGLIREIASWQGRIVVPDAFPDHGSFYRSDQFSFAGIGIPAAYVDAGTDVIGRPAGWGREQQMAFEEKHYHQPSDVLRPDWNTDGWVEDARLLFWLGDRVANAPTKPEWNRGDEFEAARKKSLAELGGK
jgi:Zn-dependent M28 family amino/carboxypeptidase